MYVYQNKVKDHSCEYLLVVVYLSIALSQVKKLFVSSWFVFFPLLSVSLNLPFNHGITHF